MSQTGMDRGAEAVLQRVCRSAHLRYEPNTPVADREERSTQTHHQKPNEATPVAVLEPGLLSGGWQKQNLPC